MNSLKNEKVKWMNMRCRESNKQIWDVNTKKKKASQQAWKKNGTTTRERELEHLLAEKKIGIKMNEIRNKISDLKAQKQRLPLWNMDAW